MLRSSVLLVALTLLFGVSAAFAQTKKPAAPGRIPLAKDNSIAVNVYMRDGGKNELMLGTRIWPDYPEYNALALQRFFAMMKSLEPAYKQDDEVAYTWGAKGKVTKCSIYLEAPEAGGKREPAPWWGARRMASAAWPRPPSPTPSIPSACRRIPSI